MTEAVRERGSPTCSLTKDTFDGIAMSVPLVAEIEAVAAAGFLERCCTIDEERGLLDVVFLTELGEEAMSKSVVSGRFKLRVK